jgi:sporulation protein YlmC with PRC-barrel domain
MEIPVDAKVYCQNEACGQSAYVVINPVLRKVTHLVVRKEGIIRNEWLVPVDWVAETGPDRIRLNRTREELERAKPFVETELIAGRESYSGYDYPANKYMEFPFVAPGQSIPVPLEHRNIPPDELAVRRGAKVEARDGRIGRVDEFMIDPTTGNISHLVLTKGHLWGKKEVTIPVCEIDRIEEGTVYLKLAKEQVESLPAIPVRR